MAMAEMLDQRNSRNFDRDVCRGLNDLELREKEHGPLASEKEVLQSPVQSAIAKVAQWQSSLPSANTLPSCYGSLPTSPSPSPPPAPAPRPLSPPDLDSGCPGSDRSTLYTSFLHSRGLSPSSKTKSRENVASTPLYTMLEEQVASSPRQIVAQDARYLTSVTIQSGLRLSPRAEAELARRRSPLASPGPVMTSTPASGRHLGRAGLLGELKVVTEPSSDERMLQEEVEEEERLMRQSLVCPATPVRTPRRALFPSQAAQPQILAEQIDCEILELRNFFEDHREEMLSLLHGDEDNPRNVSLPLFKQPEARPLQKSSSMSFLPRQPEDEGDTDRASTPPLPNPYGLPYHSYTAPSHSPPYQESQESESDQARPDRTLQLRRREWEKRRLKNRERRKRLSQENVNIQLDQSASSGGRAPISSFFPVSREQSRESPEESGLVPRLNLEDVCSDVTLPSHSLDTSLPSQLHHELDVFHLESGWGAHSPASEPVMETRRPWGEERSRSQRSIACDTLGLASPGPGVVIHQTNCDHQCRPGGRARSAKRSSRELKGLLSSLDEATALAQRLKRRSEEMLGSLGSELTCIKERNGL